MLNKDWSMIPQNLVSSSIMEYEQMLVGLELG